MIVFFYLPSLKRNLRLFLYFSLFFFMIMLNFVISVYKIEILYILTEGTFGFVPWATYFLFGLLLGDFLINSSQNRFIKYTCIILPIGTIFLIIGIINILISGVIDNKKIEFYIASLGAFVIIFLTYHYYMDIKKVDSSITRVIIRWGKLAFSIYYIQYGILAIGILMFPLFINELYSSGFLIYQYALLLIMVLVAIELFLRLWKNFDYIFGLEWFMNKISTKSQFSKKFENP